MTMKPGSGRPLARATWDAAQQPRANATAAAAASAAGPASARIAQAQGRAASDAQVPGMPGRRPLPSPVATSDAGCQGDSPSRVFAVSNGAFPAQAGTHVSACLRPDKWVPACAGKPYGEEAT